MAEQNGATFTLDGEAYELDDFDLGELEWLEEYVGKPLVNLQNFMSLRAVSGLLYLVRRRKNPELTIEEHRAVKASAIFSADTDDSDGDEDEKAAKRPPKKPART